MNKAKVAFLDTHPIQYKAPLLAYINKHSDISIEALYLTDISIRGGYDPGFNKELSWDLDLLHGYDYKFIGESAKISNPGSFFSLISPQLYSAIRDGSYEAIVISGHNYFAYQLAILSAYIFKVPLLMRCETHLGLKRSSLKTALRKPLLSAYYKLFSGFLAIGTENIKFYQEMSVPNSKIFLAPYSIDNERFENNSRLTNSELASRKNALGIHDNHPIVLFSGKFQQRKRPADLLAACGMLADRGGKFHLIMVGSGELEAELRGMAEKNPKVSVKFLGFCNQGDLPKIYGISDIFVLPSDNEPWGLAINEAMACGLPIIASNEIGAVRDIVKTGENGEIFNAGDILGLSVALEKLISSENYRKEAAVASRRIISNWSFKETAVGFVDAIKTVANN